MTISVVIPVYNAAKTIESTVGAVLRQTVPADEIILLNDGSTDDTLERLEPFKDRVTLIHQENRGMAFTRNRLAQLAKGEILAYLDNDDLWHPKYLETQRMLMQRYPEALVSFTGHVDFSGADYEWKEEPDTSPATAEWLSQVDFFKRYNTAISFFGSMSFACVRKSALNRLGPEPFQFGGADDCYLFYQVPLFGGVALSKSPLVAYRVSPSQWSVNRLRTLPLSVQGLEKLEPEYKKSMVPGLREAFPPAYAARRRYYARMLLGAGRRADARRELLRSMTDCPRPGSAGKSLAVWMASWLPSSLQPEWPSSGHAGPVAVETLRPPSPSVGGVNS